MGLKLKWIIPASVVILIILAYLVPTPKKSFEALSGDVPEEQLLVYQGFRSQFKPHRMVVQGASWEYIVVGPATETILFLHGMTGSYDIWWQQIVALRKDFQIISVTYPAVDSLEELSEGVLQILDSQNVQKTNVVGTSLGGYLAQYLVATHPERVLRAVFSNTFPPNELIRENYAIVGAALPYLPEWVIMQTLRSNTSKTIFPASGGDEFTQAYLLALASGRITKAQIIGRYRAVIEPFTPSDPLAQGIAVMIIESDNDPLVEETLREQLKEMYPFSITHTFKGAGHFPYLNRPDEYTSLLLKFLSAPIME